MLFLYVLIEVFYTVHHFFYQLFRGGRSRSDPHRFFSSKPGLSQIGSSFHVVDYNSNTGSVRSQENWQGYSDNSSWSRGQAWAVHGFTTCFRETGDSLLLATAEKCADYYINNLPADYVPYWDFVAPNIPDEPKDASAAAVAASGLLELSHLEGDTARLPAGRFAKVRVPIFPVVHPFRAGSKIRVTIMATGGDRSEWEFDTIDDGSAVNRIQIGGRRAASLTLPVMKGTSAQGTPLPAPTALRGQPSREYQPASNGG